MENFVKSLLAYLTPFTWRKLVVAVVVTLSVALALFLSACHVSRECRSFATVKIDRVDTIEYNSRIHRDSPNYQYHVRH